MAAYPGRTTITTLGNPTADGFRDGLPDSLL